MVVTVLCRVVVGCAWRAFGRNVGKEGETVGTLKKVFIVLSFLMVLWLFLCVACYPEPEPRTGTPEWLTLDYRQEGY